MSDKSAAKTQLPFVLQPYWGMALCGFLGLCLGFAPVIGLMMLWDKNLLVPPAIYIVIFFGFIDLVWILFFFQSLEKIICDEEALTISVFGLPFKKIPWGNIYKVTFMEGDPMFKGRQPRYYIYSKGSFLGLPTAINNYMFRRNDLGAFMRVVRQNTTHIKYSGFTDT